MHLCNLSLFQYHVLHIFKFKYKYYSSSNSSYSITKHFPNPNTTHTQIILQLIFLSRFEKRNIPSSIKKMMIKHKCDETRVQRFHRCPRIIIPGPVSWCCFPGQGTRARSVRGNANRKFTRTPRAAPFVSLAII